MQWHVNIYESESKILDFCSVGKERERQEERRENKGEKERRGGGG